MRMLMLVGFSDDGKQGVCVYVCVSLRERKGKERKHIPLPPSFLPVLSHTAPSALLSHSISVYVYVYICDTVHLTLSLVACLLTSSSTPFLPFFFPPPGVFFPSLLFSFCLSVCLFVYT